MSAGTGLGHYEHPWLGREVVDTATGRRGILRAVAPEADEVRLEPGVALARLKGKPVAWLQPVGGGVEWTTARTALQVVQDTPDTSGGSESEIAR